MKKIELIALISRKFAVKPKRIGKYLYGLKLSLELKITNNER